MRRAFHVGYAVMRLTHVVAPDRAGERLARWIVTPTALNRAVTCIVPDRR